MTPPPAPRPRRLLLPGLVFLYVMSLAAAVLVISRKGSDHRPSSKGLLSLKKKEDRVAWLPIHGVIYASEDGSPWKTSGAEYWGRKLKDFADKDEVKAIVLEINSPGGSVGAVQELYDQIIRIRKEKKKPVVAVMGDVAASGGYYLAAACDSVIAHPGTLTGSIGVIFQVGNVEGLFSKLGIKMDPIKSGKHKDIGSMTRTMTPEERKLLQDVIDDAYGQFLAAVEDGRKMTPEKLKPLADGRIFTGRQAKEQGLVDSLGGNDEALKKAAELGGIKGTPKILRVGEPMDEFLSFFESRMSLGAALPSLSRLGFARLEYMWQFP